MYAWKVVRRPPSFGQSELVGNFSSKKKALSHLLVVIQNDFSGNVGEQDACEVHVSVQRVGKYMLLVSGVVWDDFYRRKNYSISAFRIE